MSKRLTIFLLVLPAVSFAVALALYPGMPQNVPINWAAGGQVNAYEHKWVVLFLAVVPLLTALALTLAPRKDPLGTNFKKHEHAWSAITLALTLLLTAVSWVFILAALGTRLPVAVILPILVGALLVAVGNYVPQLRRNYLTGFRTPWAMSDERVWRKAQRAGGKVMFAAGLALIASAFVGRAWAVFAALGALLAGVVGVCVYSVVVYKRYTQKGD